MFYPSYLGLIGHLNEQPVGQYLSIDSPAYLVKKTLCLKRIMPFSQIKAMSTARGMSNAQCVVYGFVEIRISCKLLFSVCRNSVSIQPPARSGADCIPLQFPRIKSHKRLLQLEIAHLCLLTQHYGTPYPGKSDPLPVWHVLTLKNIFISVGRHSNSHSFS